MGRKIPKSRKRGKSKRVKHKHFDKIANLGLMNKMSDEEINVDELGLPVSSKSLPILQSAEPLATSAKLLITTELEENMNGSESISLQQAFVKFREIRQNEILASKNDGDEAELQSDANQVKMEELRSKFLKKCKSYIGIPYKKKYHKPGTPEYQSKLFLDCCGLVRRVLRDLRKDFGFRIGPWNQAYMFDTLPVKVKEEDMRPGDLVFISGVYFNKKQRAQAHNMVHVEVWLGDGPKTVGARWHKGHVQIFDSYQFVSTSYHSMTYHFRSIDTWLQGICKSYCHVHPWKRPKRRSPTRKSVFYRAQSPVSPESQSKAEGVAEDIVDIDATSEEESDDSAASKHSKEGTRQVCRLDPCQEDSNEEEIEELPNDSSSISQNVSGTQISSIQSQLKEKTVKYISLSKQLTTLNAKISQSRDSESISSSSSQSQISAQNIPYISVSRPQSRPIVVFTNKPITPETLFSKNTNFNIQGNKVFQKYSKTSNSNSHCREDFENKAFKIASEVIERALAEIETIDE